MLLKFKRKNRILLCSSRILVTEVVKWFIKERIMKHREQVGRQIFTNTSARQRRKENAKFQNFCDGASCFLWLSSPMIITIIQNQAFQVSIVFFLLLQDDVSIKVALFLFVLFLCKEYWVWLHPVIGWITGIVRFVFYQWIICCLCWI